MKSKLQKLWQLLRNPTKMKQYARWIGKQTKPFLPSLALMTVIDLALILVGFGSSLYPRKWWTAQQQFAPMDRRLPS